MIGTVKSKDQNIIIGSRPIALHSDWFPVHRQVATKLDASCNSQDELQYLDDIEVKRINEEIASRSESIAGPLRDQITDLSKLMQQYYS